MGGDVTGGLPVIEPSHIVTGARIYEAGLQVSTFKGLKMLVSRLLHRFCPTLEKYSLNELDKPKLSDTPLNHEQAFV